MINWSAVVYAYLPRMSAPPPLWAFFLESHPSAWNAFLTVWLLHSMNRGRESSHTHGMEWTKAHSVPPGYPSALTKVRDVLPSMLPLVLTLIECQDHLRSAKHGGGVLWPRCRIHITHTYFHFPLYVKSCFPLTSFLCRLPFFLSLFPFHLISFLVLSFFFLSLFSGNQWILCCSTMESSFRFLAGTVKLPSMEHAIWIGTSQKKPFKKLDFDCWSLLHEYHRKILKSQICQFMSHVPS